MSILAQEPENSPGGTLREYYSTLLQRLGPQWWWPARTRLEVIVGAILTQNTSWRNATLALAKLRKAGRLSWGGLRKASLAELENCVRPAGFYTQKARTIRNIVLWLGRRHRGSLNALFSLPASEVRAQLLSLKGLGPETADAILLYAGRQPFFVADAYTRRILSRHGLFSEATSYGEAQRYLHQHLPADHRVYNEFHALLVEVGKQYCKRQAPACKQCPLAPYLPDSSVWPDASAAQGEPPVLELETA